MWKHSLLLETDATLEKILQLGRFMRSREVSLRKLAQVWFISAIVFITLITHGM